MLKCTKKPGATIVGPTMGGLLKYLGAWGRPGIHTGSGGDQGAGGVVGERRDCEDEFHYDGKMAHKLIEMNFRS